MRMRLGLYTRLLSVFICCFVRVSISASVRQNVSIEYVFACLATCLSAYHLLVHLSASMSMYVQSSEERLDLMAPWSMMN